MCAHPCGGSLPGNGGGGLGGGKKSRKHMQVLRELKVMPKVSED